MSTTLTCLLAAAAILSAATPWGHAQSSNQQPAQEAKDSQATSPSGSVGLFAYPRKEQTAQKQLQDERDCFAAARQQTGIDPANPQATKTAQAEGDGEAAKTGGAGKGAVKGAAGGAAIGAIAGDTGTGAAIGATAGAVRGRRSKKKAEKEAEGKAKAAAQEQQQQQLDTFRRSMSACLDARGYSVK